MIVKEEVRAKAGLVYNVIESVILFMTVGIMSWLSINVIEQGKSITSHGTSIMYNTSRLDSLESKGSRSLEGHVKEDDARVTDLKSRIERLEIAVLSLATVPAKMDNLLDGQRRIERQFEDHTKIK